MENIVEAAGDGLLADIEALVQIAGAGNQRLVELAGTLVQRGVQLLRVGIKRGGARFELTKQLLAALAQRLG